MVTYHYGGLIHIKKQAIRLAFFFSRDRKRISVSARRDERRSEFRRKRYLSRVQERRPKRLPRSETPYISEYFKMAKVRIARHLC